MEFSRQQFVKNINNQIQQKNMKVGEVEQAIGISTGYISRLSKPGNESIPATDVTWKLARHFGVSTDALISGDFSIGEDNLSVLKRFVAKLNVQTLEGALDWRPISTKYVNEALKGQSSPFFLIKQTGLSRTAPRMPDDFSEAKATYSWFENRKIVSAACPHENAWMDGDGFRTLLPNGKWLYLFRMGAYIETGTPEGTTEVLYYEMYLSDKSQAKSLADSLQLLSASVMGPELDLKAMQVFDTLRTGDELEIPVRELYSLARQNAYDLKIEAGVKSTILSFLNDDLVPNGTADASTFPSENQN